MGEKPLIAFNTGNLKREDRRCMQMRCLSWGEMGCHRHRLLRQISRYRLSHLQLLQTIRSKPLLEVITSISFTLVSVSAKHYFLLELVS